MNNPLHIANQIFVLCQLYIYFVYGATSMAVSAVLLISIGFSVCGPFSLIATAISADIGTEVTLEDTRFM